VSSGFLKFTQTYLVGGLYGLLMLLLSASLTWGVMYKFDFFYGAWHDHGGIAEGISRYAPQNRYKDNFEHTSREERLALFAAINVSVHSGGQGLAEIEYSVPGSNVKTQLLRSPEVVHLDDVAKLLGLLGYLVLVLWLIWPVASYAYLRRRGTLPSLPYQLGGVALVFLLLGAVLLGFGAESVFNTLHIWVFPEEHQWFFYYQDSLMSTMMLAPRLFAWIAAAWSVLTILVFLAFNALLLWLLPWLSRGVSSSRG